MIRKTAALLLAILFLMNTGSAIAAPGDANDPLISQSYAMNQFRSSFALSARSIMDLAFGKLDNKYSSILAGGLSTGQFIIDDLPKGEKVNLGLGGSVILMRGAARMDISYGTVINITTGRAVDSGGELVRGNRYLAAENTAATVTMTSDSMVALDGDALVGEKRASFTDVPFTHWAFEYVELLAELGVVTGRGGGLFDPGGAVTRADFVTILGRMHRVDTSLYSTGGFSDVPSGQYYTAYVKWASDNGLVTGYGNGNFGPNDKIQRSQMALIIVRYAGFAGIALASGTSGGKFADDASIPDWARNGVYTARDAGLINGMGDNTFAPAGGATRDQMCAIISRLLAL